MRFFPLFRLGLVAGGLLAVPLLTHAQTGSVGIGTTTPNAKAALDITSSDKGLLIPRLTPAARRAIAAPPQGMLVFQTGAAAVPTDSMGIWYATGQGRRWLYLPDAQQSQVAATNGLTKTGGTVALGGPLTQPTTTVDAGYNALTFTSTGLGAAAVDQQQLTGSASSSLPTVRWQSFTVRAAGYLTRLDVRMVVISPGALTLRLHPGVGTAAAALLTQPVVTTTPGTSVTVSVPLTTPLLVSAEQVLTIGLVETSGAHRWLRATTNPYAGGRASTAPAEDFGFATYVVPVAVGGLNLRDGQVRLTGLVSSADGVSIGTPAPAASAALDVAATDKGVLVPRLTVGQRDLIAAPATGLLVYTTDCGNFSYYNGAAWVPLNNTGKSLPAPAAISGAAAPCIGQATTYSVTAVPSATSYYWTASAGTIIQSGQGTAAVSVVAGSTGTLAVTAASTCTTSPPTTFAYTGVTAAATPGAISGFARVCPGTAETYTVPNVPGLTYQWTLPTGWTGTSTTNSITVNTGNAGGDIQVKAQNACGLSVASALTVATGSVVNHSGRQTFNFTGSTKTFVVPPCVTSIDLDVRGAAGGDMGLSPKPGKGGRVQMSLAVTPGETLTIAVGGEGEDTGVSGGRTDGG